MTVGGYHRRLTFHAEHRAILKWQRTLVYTEMSLGVQHLAGLLVTQYIEELSYLEAVSTSVVKYLAAGRLQTPVRLVTPSCVEAWEQGRLLTVISTGMVERFITRHHCDSQAVSALCGRTLDQH